MHVPPTGFKREIVGKFLTETVTWEMVPRKKNEICREMVGACSHRAPLSTPGSDCARCRAAMASLQFDLRTQGAVRAAQGIARQVMHALSQPGPTPAALLAICSACDLGCITQVWDTLDYICMRMHYRVPKASKTQVRAVAMATLAPSLCQRSIHVMNGCMYPMSYKIHTVSNTASANVDIKKRFTC